MEQSERQRKSIRVCGKSYAVFSITPEPPLYDWLASLNEWAREFAHNSNPVVLDLSAVKLSHLAIVSLIAELQSRKIRVIALEGVDQSDVALDLPPVLTGGCTAPFAEHPDTTTARSDRDKHQDPASLLLESSVRSGQSIVFPEGDVTVLGSVASGAEVIAGGSIHIYGTLRGRALAGSPGNSRARIFCSKVEAELLAINGHYRTADEIDSNLRRQPIQVWLKSGEIFITPLL